MLNILNREVLKKFFSENDSEWFISFLNDCFFQGEEKVVEVLGIRDLGKPFVYIASCFQEPKVFKVRTSKNKKWVIELDVLKIHKGKDSSLIKLSDDYFDTFMKMRSSYAYNSSFLYIGMFTFDIGDKYLHYYFEKSELIGEVDFHLINLTNVLLNQSGKWSAKDQWLYLFSDTQKTLDIPSQIKEESVLKVHDILNPTSWSKEDIKDYDYYENLWVERNDRVTKIYREIGSPLIEMFLEESATDVKFSVIPLMNQIGGEDIRINISFLSEDRLQKMGFTAFRKWLKKLQKEHPHYNIVVKDERLLVKDFKLSLKSALKSLIFSNQFYLNYLPGWDVGYIKGFIIGNLSAKWQGEYILKQTNEYKMMIALKVLKDYLAYNDTLSIQLESLYNGAIESDVNMLVYNKSVEKVSDEHINKLLKKNQKTSDGSIIIAVQNILVKQIQKTMNYKVIKDIDFELDSVISNEIISELIAKNKITNN